MDTATLKCCMKYINRMRSGSVSYIIPQNQFNSIKFSGPRICIISNTSRFYPGEHWVAFYVWKNSLGKYVGECFDPLGRSHQFYSIKPPFHVVKSNLCRVQSFDQYTCGLHCLYFLYMKQKGASMLSIIRKYVIEHERNDFNVKEFYRRLAKRNSPGKLCGRLLYIFKT